MTDAAAAAVLARLGERGWTIGTAESLTGGLLAATIISVPGASAWMRGGVVAYATDVKHSLLKVDADLLNSAGAVDPAVAWQMAERIRDIVGADVGLSTTGVAGPDPQGGMPVGTVYVAVATPEGGKVEQLSLSGSREQIRLETVRCALALCLGDL